MILRKLQGNGTISGGGAKATVSYAVHVQKLPQAPKRINPLNGEFEVINGDLSEAIGLDSILTLQDGMDRYVVIIAEIDPITRRGTFAARRNYQ